MNDNLLVVIAISAAFYGTPILFASLGAMLNERSGILNLGVEGIMLMGAAFGCFTALRVDGPAWFVILLAVLVAAAAGAATAALHAVLVITFRVNQIVSGLAITLLCGATGLSSYLANVWDLGADPVRHRLRPVPIPVLADIPVAGPILFRQTLLTYAAWILVGILSWYLFRTRPGLHLRAVGESPATADAMGISVDRYRYVHTIAGGALMGVGGIYMILAVIPTWSDGITGGLGWIAIALVIFGFWRPDLILAGAFLFGAFGRLGYTLQARGYGIPKELLNSLPYLATILVLIAVSAGLGRNRTAAPAALGVAYEREER